MRIGFRRPAPLVAFVVAGSFLAMLARAAAPSESLYVRMGGTPVVTAIVSDTFGQAARDPLLSPAYQGVNMKRLERQLVAFICQLAGGGCRYTGDTMRVAHANLHITEAQFDALVAILSEQMRRHHVGPRERNELLAVLAPMKRDIVEVNVPPPPRAH